MERRGIDVGLESVDESGVVRFPIGPTVSPAQRLEDLVGQLKTHYGANPVILVDEYDAPLVHLLGKDAGPNRSWTSCATSTSSSRGSSTIYNFVFVTSNTRFGPRQPVFSIQQPVGHLLGTGLRHPVRLHRTGSPNRLHPHLATGAAHFNVSLEELMDKVRCHYNGYCFGFPEDSERVYNPFTLACCPGTCRTATIPGDGRSPDGPTTGPPPAPPYFSSGS